MNVSMNWLQARFFSPSRRKQRRALSASFENCEHRTLLSAHVGSAIANHGHESLDAKKPPKKFGGTWTISVPGNAETTGTFTQHGKTVHVELNVPSSSGPFSATGTIGKNRHLTAFVTTSVGGFTATNSIDVVLTDRTHMVGTYSETVMNAPVTTQPFTGTKV